MASSVFKLAIYAVVAVALLWILFAYIFPLFAQPEEIIGKLNNALSVSQTTLGKTYSQDIFYPADFVADAAQHLDRPYLSAVFKCNSPQLCLDAVDVNEAKRRLYIKQARTVPTSTRCREDMDYYYCTVYLGSAPAQVALPEITLPQSYDISKGEKPVLNFTVSNTGPLDATGVLGTVKLYKKTILGGKPVEQLYSEPLLKITDKIITGESKPFSFELGITENGNYVLELLVEGSDAGYEKRRFEFSISGGVERQSDCTATAAEGGAVLSEGVCVTRYLCENCENASECKWAWNEKQPELSFELSGPDYAVAETEANEWGCGDKPPEPPEPPEPPPNGTDGWTCKGAVPDAGILKMVDDYAARNKVPIDLARAVACTENDFKHGTTLNDSGAVGIMQIVVPSKKKAAAGQECINSGIIGGEQDLYNLEDNIACGTWYLRLTYDRHHAKYCCLPAGTPCFTGWEAALRAYNGAYCMVGSGSSVYVTTVLSHCPSKEACGIFEAET